MPSRPVGRASPERTTLLYSIRTCRSRSVKVFRCPGHSAVQQGEDSADRLRLGQLRTAARITGIGHPGQRGPRQGRLPGPQRLPRM